MWLNTSPMQFRTIDGLSIRYAESEERDDHALLLGPWPESLLAFDPTWARLAEQAHLVAVDLPGFGHSQRRDALLSPRAMGEFVIRVADAFGLENPHVVGPDIGTGASLFAAALHPGRLRSLVVGSGGTAFPLRLGGMLKDWVEAPDLEGYRRADPRQIVAGALTCFGAGIALPLMGRLLDSRYGWSAWFPTMAGFGFIGGCAMLLVMRKQRSLTSTAPH